MRLKKKSTLLALVLAVILAAAASYYYFAVYNSQHDVFAGISEYKGYTTAQGLYAGADLVVIGSPIKAYKDRKTHISMASTGFIIAFATFTEIKVEKVLRGPEADAVDLTVIEPVLITQTLKGKERMGLEGYTEMKKGSKYLIFLGKNSNGQYSVINMHAGKYNIDGTDPEDMRMSDHLKQRIYRDIKERYLKDVE
ncbi:hypothetical protein [Paenibacillus aquistagni]|uniref:hypothetical protein n=1 Tax=Paenibacillus aquistagni TaxID=1852522 RepID=UPI00145A2B69|nr:hypothetical protein [Paenibacillus aquistagni]NMM55015.1 hypothetical protein [Paenibacillus aquistagni]